MQAYPPTPETYSLYPLWLRSPRIPAPWGTQTLLLHVTIPTGKETAFISNHGIQLLRTRTRNLLHLLLRDQERPHPGVQTLNSLEEFRSLMVPREIRNPVPQTLFPFRTQESWSSDITHYDP